MHAGGKSVGASRHGPRSIAITSRPSSVSSLAMIDPVQPRPMITTSFFGSLLAMDRPQRVCGVHSARPVMLTGGSGKNSFGQLTHVTELLRAPGFPNIFQATMIPFPAVI